LFRYFVVALNWQERPLVSGVDDPNNAREQTMSYENAWREDASLDNPAGPLFAGGEFAAAEIVCESSDSTLICSGVCGTVCSGSAGHPCC